MSSFQDADASKDTEFKRCPQCGCVGINPGYESLTTEQIDEQFLTLAQGVWILSEDKKKISRKFVCRNWKSAIEFIDAAGVIAEEADVNHHPDLHLTKYRDIEVVCWTHASGGLTAWDFVLARALDKIKVDYSPKWLKEHEEAVSSDKTANADAATGSGDIAV